MPTFVATAALPPDTWVGFGDDRRYLLRADEQGWLWPWFYRDGQWAHALDPAGEEQLWTVHDRARNGYIDSLNDHIRHIATEGCGAMGWCSHHHSKPEAR